MDNQNKWQIYHQLGVTQQEGGDWDGAIQSFQSAIELNPQSFWSYHKLGEIFLKLEQWQEAVINYEKAIEINPNFSWSYYSLGDALLKLEKWEKTAQSYEKSIQLNPEFWGAYHNLGDTLFQLKKHEDAIGAYRRATELNPEFPWSYHNLGLVFSELEQWEEAASAYRKAIELNPNNSWYYENLAKALLSLEKWEELLGIYRHLIELNPDAPIYQEQLGNALLKLDKLEEAVAAYQQLIELNPDGAWHYYHLGILFKKSEKWQDAIASFQKAIQLNDQMGLFHINLGEAFSKVENWGEAAKAYQHAIELDSNNSWFYQLLGNNLEKQGKLDDAIAAHQKALDISPNCYWHYYDIAEIFHQQEKWDDAISFYIKTLKIHPDYSLCYEALGKILQKKGDNWNARYCLFFNKLPINLLKKYGNFTRDLVTNSKLDPHITRKNIHPVNYITLQPSITIAPNPHEAFKVTQTHEQESFITIIPNARVWGSASTSAVITSNQKLVADISTGSAELIVLSEQLPPPVKIDGTVAFLSVQWAHNNYYHWMIDLISRFDLLIRSGIPLESIDKFVVNSCILTYQKETLQLLKIPAEKIIESRNITHFLATKLIVPSPLILEEFRSSQWVCSFLKNQFCLPNFLDKSTDAKRIYISRVQSSTRKIINEEEMINFLEKYGFQKVTFESMSFAEQVACIGLAEVVIAPHGAGLTNLVFSAPGTKVIEIFPASYITNCYWEICHSCSLEHYFLICDQSPEQNYCESQEKHNIFVNLEKLQLLMEVAGIFIEETIPKPHRIQDAIALYQESIKLTPKNIQLYEGLGLLFLQQKKWNDAIMAFIQALQIKPDFYISYNKIAEILDIQGDTLGANLSRFQFTLSHDLLQKYSNFTEDLIINSQEDASFTRLKIHPPETRQMLSSQTLGDIKDEFQQHNGNFVEAFLTVIPYARVWADIGTSAVISSDNKLVRDISTGCPEVVISSDKLPEPININNRVAFLSVQWGGAGYFHWMFDLMTRFDLLERSGIDLESIDKFIVNSYKLPYQRETLNTLGIPASKIIDSSVTPHIQAKSIIIPSVFDKNSYDRLSKWGCDFLRKTFLKEGNWQKSDYPKRIYISREKASYRQVINNEDVFYLLAKHGFKKVIFETLTLAEQSLYMAAADVIVAPHGAGLTNLVFCQPGTKVLEIFSPNFHPNYYWALSNICGLDHYYLMGEVLVNYHTDNPIHQDILVNVAQLEQLIDIAGVN
jgi:tetratricopeptide (TPR) repeat protein